MEINKRLKAIPTTPGVYLMKDEKGRILYIGKAASLRKRLKSYFYKKGHFGPKIQVMLTKFKTYKKLGAAIRKEEGKLRELEDKVIELKGKK